MALTLASSSVPSWASAPLWIFEDSIFWFVVAMRWAMIGTCLRVQASTPAYLVVSRPPGLLNCQPLYWFFHTICTNKNIEPLCKSMNYEWTVLRSVLTGRQFQSFCNPFSRSLLAKQQNAGSLSLPHWPSFWNWKLRPSLHTVHALIIQHVQLSSSALTYSASRIVPSAG